MMLLAAPIAAACPPEPKLTGDFWLVKTAAPKLCLPPLAPFRALPDASAELEVTQDADAVHRARGRWTAPGRQPSAWSELSQPFMLLPPGVQPDANGDGLVSLGSDGKGFLAAFWDGHDLRFDFDGNGRVTAGDARGFFAVVGGQVR